MRGKNILCGVREHIYIYMCVCVHGFEKKLSRRIVGNYKRNITMYYTGKYDHRKFLHLGRICACITTDPSNLIIFWYY